MATILDYLAAGDTCVLPAKRLCKALNQLGLSDATEDGIYDLLVGEFDHRDLFYCKQLTTPASAERTNWHRITLGSGAPLIQERHDSLTVATSEIDALAFIIEEVDGTRTSVTDIRVSDSSIELRNQDGLVVSIEPIRFENVRPEYRERISRSLKGVRGYGDEDKLIRRLHDIPGLEAMEIDPDRSTGGPRRGPFLHTAASLCAVLRDMLQDALGIELKIHQAQELFAAMIGANDWQSIVRCEAAERVWISPTCLYLLPIEQDPEARNVRLFRSLQDALWEFGQTMKTWSGGPLRIDVATTVSSTGPYIRANLVEDWNRQEAERGRIGGFWALPQVSLGCPPISYPDQEKYVNLASTMLDRRANAAQLLGETLGAGPVGANQRLGYSDEKTLLVGQWIISIKDGKQAIECRFHFERMDETGQRRLESFWIKKRCAAIGRTEVTKKLAIIDTDVKINDEPQHALPLGSFSPDERRRILNFLGVHYCHWSLGWDRSPSSGDLIEAICSAKEE